MSLFVKPKDVTGLRPVCPFRSLEQLELMLLGPNACLGPIDGGTLDLVVLRPSPNERLVVDEVLATAKEGVHGSGWTESSAKGLTDQVCVMSTAAITAIATEDPETWSPAGDQLFLDFDLSESNISPGDRVRIGDVELVMTTKPHTGCAKFVARYGIDALKAVSCPEGKRRRLRGIYFYVIKDGVLRRGDKVEKIPNI